MLNETVDTGVLDINCCDPLGRSALLMAIDNENLEMVDLLLDNKVLKTFLLYHYDYIELLLDNKVFKTFLPYHYDYIDQGFKNIFYF